MKPHSDRIEGENRDDGVHAVCDLVAPSRRQLPNPIFPACWLCFDGERCWRSADRPLRGRLRGTALGGRNRRDLFRHSLSSTTALAHPSESDCAGGQPVSTGSSAPLRTSDLGCYAEPVTPPAGRQCAAAPST